MATAKLVRSVLVPAISVIVGSLAGVSHLPSRANAATLVVSPPGFDDVEGEEIALVQPGTAAPDGFRAQFAYLASDFSGLPEGHNRIVSMAWRPDWTMMMPNAITFNSFELRLSTTSAAPGALSNTFAMNTGGDEKTVYSGPLTLATEGAGGPPDGPRPFDYLIEFQEPFVYDPSQGNLLVDFSMLPPIDGTTNLDSQTTSLIQSVGALDASLLTANRTTSEAYVTRFTFIPEASTFVLASLALAGLLVARKSCRLLGTVCVIAVLLGSSQTSSAQLTTVSPAGAEDSDADLVVFPIASPFPDHPKPPSNGFRFQELHPTAFESLGPGPFFITGMAWRPDISVNAPVSTEWEIVALNLSTTPIEPGDMSLTFADNYGPDGATTVFSGTMQFETDGAPSGGGLPHDFDYVFEFDTPYLYDPAEGSLLFEFMAITEDNPWIWADGAGQSQFTIALSPDADEAFNTGPAIIVTQFTFTRIPEPSTWVLALLLGAGATVARSRCIWAL